MELIQNWFDRFYNATNNIYQLPNGLKVLHTIDPKTTDTTINVVTKSGAYRDIEHIFLSIWYLAHQIRYLRVIKHLIDTHKEHKQEQLFIAMHRHIESL